MIAVVTGASGFIGRNLVGRLLNDGHEVRCLTRPHGGLAPEGAAATQVDFNDVASLRALKALDGADVVFHLAAAMRARSEAAFEAANVAPTRNLLHALADNGSPARFVFVSSQAAAGPATSIERPIVESDEPRPVEAYGRSKALAERVVSSFADRLPVSVVRPSSVYGRFDRDFLRLFQMARRGIVLYPGTMHHWLSLTHADDVVEGMLAAATSPNAIGRTFFLAAEPAIQWRALGDRIADAVGRPVGHLNVPGSLVRAASLLGDAAALVVRDTPLLNTSKAELARQPLWVCSSERARTELGWIPSRSLPEGLRDTYLWYEQRAWLSGPSRSSLATA